MRDCENSFLCSSFPDLFYVKNISICNEYRHELTLLSMVLSTLAAPLWINVLILVYSILV